jgi:hypothetical protein
VIREGEFVKLFIHEFAHFIDIYILTSTSGVDPSDEFYNISWEDAYTKHA